MFETNWSYLVFIFIITTTIILNIDIDYDISSNLGDEADTSDIHYEGILNSYIPYGNSTSPNQADGYLIYLCNTFIYNYCIYP